MLKKKWKEFFMSQLPLIFTVPALLWPILLLLLPMMVMIVTSFLTSEGNCCSFNHYLHFVDWLYVSIFIRSFVLALVTASCTLLLGFPVAYYVAVHARRAKQILLFLLTLPFWTNFIVQVYAWFFILEKQGLLNSLLLHLGIIAEPIQFSYTFGAVLLLMVYCYLPFMIMPIYTVLEKLNLQLLEASMDLGATRTQTFWRVTLPLSLSGIRTGVALVFVPAFGEFVIPSLVGGGKFATAGSMITYYFLTEHNIAYGAAFTVLTGMMLILSIILLNYFLRTLHHN